MTASCLYGIQMITRGDGRYSPLVHPCEQIDNKFEFIEKSRRKNAREPVESRYGTPRNEAEILAREQVLVFSLHDEILIHDGIR
jgi:hypothetical protein